MHLFINYDLLVVDFEVGSPDDVGRIVLPLLQLVEQVDEGAEHEAVVGVQRVQTLGLELYSYESIN